MSGIRDRDIERLETLGKLRDSGALSDAEFQVAKAKILSPASGPRPRSASAPRAAAPAAASSAFGVAQDQRVSLWRRWQQWRGLVMIIVAVLLWASFMVATAGTAVIPSIQKWAAPLMCQAPYGTMVISSQSGSYMPGSTYTDYSEACTDGHGHFKPLSGLADRAVVWGESFLVLLLLAGLVTVLVVLRRKRSERRSRRWLEAHAPGGAAFGDSN